MSYGTPSIRGFHPYFYHDFSANGTRPISSFSGSRSPSTIPHRGISQAISNQQGLVNMLLYCHLTAQYGSDPPPRDEGNRSRQESQIQIPWLYPS